MKIVYKEKNNIYNHFIFYSLINKFLAPTLLTHLEKTILEPPLVAFCIFFSRNLLNFLGSRFQCKSLFYNLKYMFLNIYFSYFLGCWEQWFFFFFLKAFQPMASTHDDSSLSSNQDINKFLM